MSVNKLIQVFFITFKKGNIIAKSVGKAFEQNFKNSIPKNIFYYRPPDAAQSFGNNQNLRFSAKSPCDCFMFDGDFLYAFELKSVGTKSISYEISKNDNARFKYPLNQE